MKAAFGLILIFFVVLMSATWFRHTDVGDAQLYQVIARQMGRSGNWLSMEYLGRPFYDHLPFGLWPIMAAQQLDERAVIPLHAFFSVLTVVLVGAIGHRLSGPWGGLASMFTLATTQMYFFQTSYPTLEPLLLLLTTASVLPVISREPTRTHWFLAWLFAAMAVAVKGPFGLLPLGGVIGARAIIDRDWRHLGFGAATFLLAMMPVALFLLLRPDWREGYGAGQLLSSAVGERTDGHSGWAMALQFIVERYWPWFPLLFVCLAVAWRAPAEPTRFVTVACALVLVGLSLPHRKLWHHTLVVYPLLSVAIGVTLGPRLSNLLRGRRLILALSAMTVLSALAVAGGVDRLLMARPCVLATDFSEELKLVHAGQIVPVISERDEWDMLSALAFERDVTPVRTASWEGVSAPVALVTEEAWSSAPSAWSAIKHARGWVFAVKAQ